MRDDLGWFWQTDRVIAVLHVAGGRGGAIHQLISFSPEVAKRKVVEVHNGAAHANQEGLGYHDPSDPGTPFNMHMGWRGLGTGQWPASAMSGRSLEDLRDEISSLRNLDGERLVDAVARGGFLAYRCYPSLDDGELVWPNRRVVASYHTRIGRSLREWYQKGLMVGITDWQDAHLRSLGVSSSPSTVLDYYTIAHGGRTPNAKGHRGYLRDCIKTMERNQEYMLSRTGTHLINVDEFFTDRWMPYYIDLCAHCGITPNIEMAAEFMDKYLTQQWSRG